MFPVTSDPMKTCSFFLLLLSAFLWPVITLSQPVRLNAEERARLHNEVPDMPYLPNPNGRQLTTPAMRLSGEGFSMVQVNVDANGNNIVGDAANEPTIVVNPKDHNRMVIGWREFESVNSNFRQAGVAYSTDAGATWTFPGPIEPGVFRSDPVLDADSSGVVFYNSLTSNSGVYTCQVFRSQTGGINWNPGVEARGGDKQWMTIDRSESEGNGHIYSNWTSYYSSCAPGAFTRSTDGGNFYEECTMIEANPYWGTLTTGNNGELYIAGAGPGDGIVLVRSSNAKVPGASVSWDMSTYVDMDGYVASQASVNPVGLLGQVYVDVDRSEGPGRGNIYLLASMVRLSTGDPGDVMFARSTDGGWSWSAPIRINDDPYDFHHQWFGTMSVAPNGRIDVIWLDTRDDPNLNIASSLYYCHSDDQGETWSINKRLTDSFDPRTGYPQQGKIGDYFDMESDNEGAFLAWANTFNGEQDVYYSRILSVITGQNENPGEVSPALLEAIPNPVQSHTRVRITLPRSGMVNLDLCDIYGYRLRTLISGQREPGNYSFEADMTDLPAGVYMIRLRTGSETVTRKLIRL